MIRGALQADCAMKEHHCSIGKVSGGNVFILSSGQKGLASRSATTAYPGTCLAIY